jgi:inactivated superfamily I helicase
VTFFETTQVDRASWQRRAAAELAAILDTHRDLPVIAWTVGPAGANLIGHVNGLAPAATVREVFDTWRAALALDAPDEPTSGGGSIALHAVAVRNRVRVGLTATILHDGRETNR